MYLGFKKEVCNNNKTPMFLDFIYSEPLKYAIWAYTTELFKKCIC
jgi:hypothetical protein